MKYINLVLKTAYIMLFVSTFNSKAAAPKPLVPPGGRRPSQVRVVPYTKDFQNRTIVLLMENPSREFAPFIKNRFSGEERQIASGIMQSLGYSSQLLDDAKIIVGTRTGDFYFFVPVEYRPVHKFKNMTAVWLHPEKIAASQQVITSRLQKTFIAWVIQSFHEFLKNRWLNQIKPMLEGVKSKKEPEPEAPPKHEVPPQWAPPPVGPVIILTPEVQTALGLTSTAISAYDILSLSGNNVNEVSSQSDLNTAYKKMSLKWHPDKNPDKAELATEVFKTIGNAKDAIFAARGW